MHIVAWLSPNYIIRNRKKWNNYDKIDELMKVWATEFFVWYVPNYWYEKVWFEISPNGRQSAQAQIQSKKELQEIRNYITERNWEMLMTLNANSYNKTIWEQLKQMIQDWMEIWIDGFIVSDLWVLEYLKEIWYKGKINLSTIFNIYSIESVKFFIDNYNINRVVLPREVTLKEIKEITSTFPKMEFEVFLSWDHCIWNNGSCFTEHNTKWGNQQFKNTISWNPHSYCQFIEKNYIPKKVTNYNFKDILKENISEEEILKILDNEVEDNLKAIWERLISSIWEIEIQELKKHYNWFKNKAIALYDNSYSPEAEYNKDIIRFIWGFTACYMALEEENEDLSRFIKEKKEMISKGKKFYEDRIKEEWLEYINKVDLLEWNRNGFETLEVLKDIPNVVAVKVPSRWKDLSHIRDYITWVVDKEEYMVKNFLSYEWDNSTRKFNYYNSLNNKYI